MTKDEISKLPTPETDALVHYLQHREATNEELGADDIGELIQFAQLREQRLAAAVMALEDCRKELLGAEHHVPSHTWSLAIQRVVGESKETIAAIRGGK